MMRFNARCPGRGGRAAIRRTINIVFDGIVQLNSRVFAQSEAAFPVMIGSGIAIGITAGLLVAPRVGLSFERSAETLAIALLGGLSLPAARLTIGTESEIVRWASNGVYHYQAAAFTAAGIFVGCKGWPVLPCLDILAVGMATVQVLGRTGCLLAGCCHGRPNSWGIQYRADGAGGAVRGHLIGVRLYPIQAFEAVWLAMLVAPGSILLLSSRSPADSITWYVVAYGAGRFVFEFGRGDSCRLYFRGLSEPQWTAVIFSLVIGASMFLGLLRPSLWLERGTVLTLALVWGAALIVGLRGGGDEDLLNSQHVREVAEAIEWASIFPNTPGIPAQYASRTSLGCRIAAESFAGQPNACRYLLSRFGKRLSLRDARKLGRLILALQRAGDFYKLTETRPGTYALTIQMGKPFSTTAGATKD